MEDKSIKIKAGTSESSLGINEISIEALKISEYAEEIAQLIDSLSVITAYTF